MNGISGLFNAFQNYQGDAAGRFFGASEARLGLVNTAEGFAGLNPDAPHTQKALAHLAQADKLAGLEQVKASINYEMLNAMADSAQERQKRDKKQGRFSVIG